MVTLTPVGELEIAARLNVQPNTVHQWRKRGILPAPAWTVSGQPAWELGDIESWAYRTGRLTDDLAEVLAAEWAGLTAAEAALTASIEPLRARLIAHAGTRYYAATFPTTNGHNGAIDSEEAYVAATAEWRQMRADRRAVRTRLVTVNQQLRAAMRRTA